jgi:hypothetical protein
VGGFVGSELEARPTLKAAALVWIWAECWFVGFVGRFRVSVPPCYRKKREKKRERKKDQQTNIHTYIYLYPL